MIEDALREILQQILRSRMSMGIFGVLIALLLSAAFSRLIPWGLFFVILGLLVVGSFLWQIGMRWWAERKDESLEKGISEQGSQSLGRQRVRDREAIRELQTKWSESVETLKKSRVGRKRQPLYFLPWYVIVGAPACGKSTAIKNSGLHFPMGEPKLAGTGGTRNCDWWFAEEAIILDTAGRYTFHDEHEPDREEWVQFLKLLRKYRPLAPINGLLVAVSADHLLDEDDDVGLSEARNIRHKIDQIVREFGIQFPIYLLVTKCDLIDGFTEFFGRLPKTRLDEMLGWTNPRFDMADPPKVIGEAVQSILQRAQQLRTSFLWDEERPEPLRKIFTFPEELRAFAVNLQRFCDVLFKETQYNESPFLRGIYLTSGLQTGTAISRMLERLGLRNRVSELPETKRSYFLKDLFQTRLPADKNLVASTGRSRGRLQAAHNLGLAVVAGLCVVFGAMTSNSYVRNRTLLNNLQDAVEAAIEKREAPHDERIASESAYVDYLGRLDALNRSQPLLSGFGLYMGHRAYEPARDLFLRTFALNEYGPAMEAARARVRERSLDRGFEGLAAIIRNYVLSKELNGTTKQPTGPNETLVEFWSKTPQVTPETLSDFDNAYFTFLRWRPGPEARIDEDGDLRLIREALPEMLTIDNVARWAEKSCEPFRGTGIPGPGSIAGGASVPGSFTPACWQNRVQPLLGVVELVVEDISTDVPTRFRKAYIERYFEHWFQFLDGIQIAPAGTVPLDALLGEATPYLATIDATAQGVRIDTDGLDVPAWTRVVEKAHSDREEYLVHLQSVSKQTSEGQRDNAVAFEISSEIFTRRVAPADAPESQPTDPFGKALFWVEKAIEPAAAGDTIDARVRTHVQDLLSAPVYDAWGAFLVAAGREMEEQWRATVVTPVARAKSPRETEPIYSPNGGDIWKYFDRFVAPFVESRSKPTPKVRYRRNLPVRSDLGDFLGNVRAAAAGAAAEPTGGTLRFSARPTDNPPGDLEASRTVLTIECGGEAWVLEHRQFQQSKALSWAPGKCQQIELQVWAGSSRGGDERALPVLVFSGPKALPNFLRSASRSGNEYKWPVPGGYTVTFVVSGVDSDLFAKDPEILRPPGSLLR